MVTDTKPAALRVYPSCCTSAFCGRTDCNGCKNLPVKQDFDRWRDEHAAVQPDWIWSPSVWRATR